MAVFRRQLAAGYRELLAALPEGCFGDAPGEDAPFTVPLSSLLEKPPPKPSSGSSFRRTTATHAAMDLFKELRQRFNANLLVASGLPPTASAEEASGRVVMPTRHKSASPTELAELYLGGTPFGDVLDLPVPFSVPDGMRFEHCHVIGGTGHGKTQLLQRMILADLKAGAARRALGRGDRQPGRPDPRSSCGSSCSRRGRPAASPTGSSSSILRTWNSRLR
ncbi:MAG: hypothetical protein WDN31_02420 [Hyphomicrobium sp.]